MGDTTDIEQVLLKKYMHSDFFTGSGKPLIAFEDSMEFIDDCERLQCVILGVDFFYERDGYIISTTLSADWSSISRLPDAVSRTAAETRRFINNGYPDGTKWAEFVLRCPGSRRGFILKRQ
jgi:hypothetical protein